MSDASPSSPAAKRRAKAAATVAAKQSASQTPAPPPPPILPPEPPEAARPASHRLLRAALAVSVALNLLVAGVVVGGLFYRGEGGGRAEMTRDLGFGPFGEALTPKDRRALREWLKTRAPELRSANMQRRADMVALQAALRAQPFDAAGLRAALSAMRARMEGQLALGHAALSKVILGMPEAERRAFADRLERGIRRGADDPGRKGDAAQ